MPQIQKLREKITTLANSAKHLLAEKGLNHELQLWGHDVSHDWHWWQRQIAEYLPRFC